MLLHIKGECMMLDIGHLNLQYITDDEGEKKAVILPIEDFLELLEDLEDIALVAERRDEPTESFDKVIAELKDDGFLPN